MHHAKRSLAVLAAALILAGAASAANRLSIGGGAAAGSGYNGSTVATYSFQDAWPKKVGERGSGRATLTLKGGALSRTLSEAQRTGRKIPAMRLTVEEGGETLAYELKNVFITSYSVSGSGEQAMETVTMTCEFIQRVSV